MKVICALSGLASSLAVLIAASSANAATFVGYGTALPPGQVLVTNFGDSSASNLSGDGLFETGSYSFSAAPAFSPSTRDPDQYLSLQTGQSETVTLPSYKDVSIYLGSLDSYNTISFSNGQSFTGGQLAALTGAVDNGDQSGAEANGRFSFQFSSPVNSVTFSSSNIAFEVADVAGAVPEPATWAMMLLGVGIIGGGLRMARRKEAMALAAV